MNEISNRNLYKLGKKLRLRKHDIDLILNISQQTNEPAVVLNGPPWYPGTHYGSISISDFKKLN